VLIHLSCLEMGSVCGGSVPSSAVLSPNNKYFPFLFSFFYRMGDGPMVGALSSSLPPCSIRHPRDGPSRGIPFKALLWRSRLPWPPRIPLHPLPSLTQCGFNASRPSVSQYFRRGSPLMSGDSCAPPIFLERRDSLPLLRNFGREKDWFVSFLFP